MFSDIAGTRSASGGEHRDERRRLCALTEERVKLDAVARGERRDFVECRVRAAAGPLAERRETTPESFSIFERRRTMVYADADNPVDEHSERVAKRLMSLNKFGRLDQDP
jgi:hypothetical protein